MGCLEVLLEVVMSVSVEGKSKHGGKSWTDHLKEWDPSGWGTDHVIPLVPYPEPQNNPIP